MAPNQGTCFDAGTLSQFLHEQLSEPDEASVVAHLSTCSDCQQALESIAADGSMWSDLRSHFSDQTHDSDVDVSESSRDQIVESVMEFLGPTDDPAMLGRLGAYEVSGIVGRGSTGVVVKALEKRLNRFVAIKVLAPNFASNGSARTRFEREARAVAAVAHEHVVPIFAVDEFRGLPFLVMQYVGGGSLQQRIERDGPMDACEVVRIGMQVASGLAAAHAQGIVHRDVKPANVMLESGIDRAMVTDFGLARVADEASMTRSGAITGTPQFMSPEQAKGEYIDHRSDLFSLGSLMYTASTGRPPFRSETVYGVIRRVCESTMRPIQETNPEIPSWLEAFIDKLCAKDREERFQTAEEVRESLARELAHLHSPSTIAAPVRKWLKRPIAEVQEPRRFHRWLAWLGATVAALAIAGAAVQGLLSVTHEPPATTTNDNAAVAPSIWNAGNLPVFESTISRALPVEPKKRLKLIAGRGNVQIFSSESQQLEVRVTRRVAAETQSQATQLFAMHQLVFTPDAAGMIVESLTQSESINGVSPFGHFSLKVFIPDQFGVDISTTDGDIVASSIDGDIVCASGNGIINVETVRGDVSATTTGGHVRFGQVAGDISANTLSGHVVVDSIAGSAGLRSSSGDIVVTFSGPPMSGSELTTDRGNISIGLPSQARFDLNATAHRGLVRAPGDDSQTQVLQPVFVSKLNGGGPSLTATSGEGHISIKTIEGLWKSKSRKSDRKYE